MPTTVAQQLSIGGRVVLCGLIKDYNGDHKTAWATPGVVDHQTCDGHWLPYVRL